MSEEEVPPLPLIEALLRLDAAFRSAMPAEVAENELPEEHQRQLELAAGALRRLESELPRSIDRRPAWVPDRIGRFEIQTVLGVGGFSIVYLGQDTALNRRVAVKIPRPACLVDSELRRRFITEARSSALLDHPNIVPIFEAGESEDLPWLACALCEGPNLDEWLRSRQEPVSPRVAAEIIRRLARAVQYSHERGVLHRDIKPDNVLLFPDTDSGIVGFPFQPRLADFGLAKLLDAGRATVVTSQLLGSPRYLAPEVVRGSTAAATEHTDVYALGAVLYCLITGSPPFTSASTAETLRRIVESDPPNPRSRDTAIPADLSHICLKCLEKEPQRRYATAGMLADDLQQFLSNRPVIAKAPSAAGRLFRWAHRQPLAATTAAVAILAVLTALLFWFGWTRSLTEIQSQLRQRNTELSQRLSELSEARQSEIDSRLQSTREHDRAEQLVFAADLHLADSLWHAGDPAAAARIFQPYRMPTDAQRRGSSSGAEFAVSVMQQRISRQPGPVIAVGQTVWDMKLSPDGQLLAVCGTSGRVQLLRAGSLELVADIPVSTREINELAWSSDHSILAAGDDDGVVFLIDPLKHAVRRKISAFSSKPVFGLLFLPADQQLLICGQDASLLVSDVSSGEVRQRILTGHRDRIETLSADPTGRFVLTAGDDGRVCRFELPSWQLAWQFQLPSESLYRISTLAIDSPGDSIFLNGGIGEVWRLDAASGQGQRIWRSLDRVFCLAHVRSRLIVGDAGGVLSELADDGEETDARPVSQWQAGSEKVSAIELLADPHSGADFTVFSADRSGRVSAWSLSNREPAVFLPSAVDNPEVGSHSVAWLNNFSLLQCTASGLLIHRSTAGPHMHAFADRRLTACAVAAHRTGLVVAGTNDGVALVQDSEGRVLELPLFPGSRVSVIAIDDNGQTAAFLSEDDSVALVRISDGTELLRLTGCSAIAITSNGRMLASAHHSSNHVQLWTIADPRQPLQIHAAHRNTVCDLQFADSDRLLLSASHDRSVAVTDVDSRKILHRMSGSPVSNMRLTAHPDGRLAARMYSGGRLALLDLAVGRELMILDEEFERIRWLAFSPAGDQLAVLDSEGRIRVIQPVPTGPM